MLILGFDHIVKVSLNILVNAMLQPNLLQDFKLNKDSAIMENQNIIIIS